MSLPNSIHELRQLTRRKMPYHLLVTGHPIANPDYAPR